jgi:hypothetical protein
MRLAALGYWVDASQPTAQARVASLAQRLKLSPEDAARRLARNPRHVHAAVRRQWGNRVLWYAIDLREVLDRCAQCPESYTLLDALQLHESDSGPTIDASQLDHPPVSHGVVLSGGQPVGVLVHAPRMTPPPASMQPPQATPQGPGVTEPRHPPRASSSPHKNGHVGSVAVPPAKNGGGLFSRSLDGLDELLGTSASVGDAPRPVGHKPPQRPTGPTPVGSTPVGAEPEAPAVETPASVPAWPRVEAPQVVAAGQAFELVVGFAPQQQAGVSGGVMNLPRRTHEADETLNMTVELIAQGLDAPQGWSRPLKVRLADPTQAEARFQLVGRPPLPMPGHDGITLTTLEVRYVLDGSVCGTASRPLVVTAVAGQTLDRPFGQPWSTQPPQASPVTLQADSHTPDLTIEIVKPDRNAASGRYLCKLYSPHALGGDMGPHEMDLGQDAKTFAKQLVDEVRLFAGNVLIETTLEAAGRAVAERLPAAVFDALAEVATRTQPGPPAVLIVSAEPYVPWELAWLDTPLDAQRPAHLGAQTLLGRWLRDDSGAAPPRPGTTPLPPRPPTQPPAAMAVQHMAVMAGLYKAESGLRRLPKAEDEAQQLASTYAAQALQATAKDVKQLIDAKLAQPVQAVHVAGHGDFDPNQPDSATLFLQDGTPLKSMLFRAANYGGAQQPLIFLNCCMVGVGGELLGDMGGFPGNCLRGGFGGVLGALWEIDDTVAHDVALEFWRRALPAPGSSQKPEPVAAILRDLRAKVMPTQPDALPVHTYLAYVFYGHPRLTLARA